MANVGYSFSFREGTVIPVIPTTVSESLLIIGTALDGPSGVPVPVSDMATALAVFGPMVFKDEYVNPANNTADGSRAYADLVEAIERALAAGNNNIVAYRVPGAPATANIDALDAPTGNVLQAVSLFDGYHYNGITFEVLTGTPNYSWRLTQPANRGGVVTGSIAPTDTLQDLVDAVNNHASNTTVRLQLHPSAPATALSRPVEDLIDDASPADRSWTLSGGSYGRRPDHFNAANGYQSLLNKLIGNTGAFAVLQDQDVSVIYLSCLYADDKVNATDDDSVLIHLAKFAHDVSVTAGAHAVISAQPYVAPDGVTLDAYYRDAYLDPTKTAALGPDRIPIARFLNAHPQMLVQQADGSYLDYGRYLSVVVGMPVEFNSIQLGVYITDAGASYAGMLTVLGPAEITAFRSMRGIRKLAGARIPRALLSDLMDGVNGKGGGYVVIRPSILPAGDPIVANDITAAQGDSAFHMLSNVRIANLVSRYLRQALVPFLGKPNTQDTLTAMSTAVRSVLNRFVELNALLGGEGVGYRFSLTPMAVGLQTTEIRCVVDIRPASYIRAITLDLTVTL